MSYQALYRKYRPQNLNQVYGQKIVVNILKNAINNNRFSHAYLFTGPRGCGKTSVAKIVARMINCENIIDCEPCGKCNGCLNSNSNNCVDILEIDAASNNGVDEIRELKSKINLIPSVLKYKVYIIDEVHMLSDSAFNALLKTLEEPPEHVIFILATTELHKVPVTIVSRCQTIEFKKINNNDMFERLREISDLENIKISDDAIHEIINVSDGGLRDAIGMLDMAISYTNDEISEEDILKINGNISNNEIDYLADQIIKRKQNNVMKLINDYYDSGKDLIKILEKIIFNLKNRMINENDINICSILEVLTDAIDKMKDSSIDKVYFEVAIFKICNEISKDDQEKLKPVEEKKQVSVDLIKENKKMDIDQSNTKEKEDDHDQIAINDELKKIRINNTFVNVNKQSLNEYKKMWLKLNDFTFDRIYGASVCELLDATPVAASNDHLILSYNYDSFVEKGNKNLEKYEKTLKNTIGLEVKIIFVSEVEWRKIKLEYIENIKNNKKYNHIEEIENNDNNSNTNKKNDDILNKVSELFDMNKIEIKENL